MIVNRVRYHMLGAVAISSLSFPSSWFFLLQQNASHLSFMALNFIYLLSLEFPNKNSLRFRTTFEQFFFSSLLISKIIFILCYRSIEWQTMWKKERKKEHMKNRMFCYYWNCDTVCCTHNVQLVLLFVKAVNTLYTYIYEWTYNKIHFATSFAIVIEFSTVDSFHCC